jgi:hypothetical protein
MSLLAVPPEVLNARPQAAKDFDFLQGRWLIHHHKLAERLVGCETWVEFETPAANQLILGGLGNIDHLRIETGEFFEGASSPWSGRQHKAWGVSPRNAVRKSDQARVAGGSRIISIDVKVRPLSPASQARFSFILVLGLTPQALC